MSEQVKTAPATSSAQPINSKLTRQEQLNKLLTRKSGATIAQMQNAFGWQPHTARAAISGQRKDGSIIERRDNDKGSVYQIVMQSGTQ